MDLKEIWERYGHLDKLLSDREWIGEGLKDKITFDLWSAIKEELHKPQGTKVSNGTGAFVTSESVNNSNSTIHYLKCKSPYFKDVMSGVKTFEVRRNDKDFKVNDILMFEEIASSYPTGHKFMTRITYIFPLCVLKEFYPEWQTVPYSVVAEGLNDYVVLGLSIK